MNAKLFTQAIIKVISGILLVGVLLFLPAGSFSYWNAWLQLGILFIVLGQNLRSSCRTAERSTLTWL